MVTLLNGDLVFKNHVFYVTTIELLLAFRKSDGKYVKRLKWYITRKPGESQGMLYLEIKWGSIKIYTVSPTAVSNQENEEGMLKVSRINMKEEFYNGYRIEVGKFLREVCQNLRSDILSENAKVLLRIQFRAIYWCNELANLNQ